MNEWVVLAIAGSPFIAGGIFLLLIMGMILVGKILDKINK